jgi:hypothetical protein
MPPLSKKKILALAPVPPLKTVLAALMHTVVSSNHSTLSNISLKTVGKVNIRFYNVGLKSVRTSARNIMKEQTISLKNA